MQLIWYVIFEKKGSLDLLHDFFSFLLSNLIPLSYRTSHSWTFLFPFPIFGCTPFTALHPVLVDGHSSFPILLTDSGMIRCTSLCPSTFDGHDVLRGVLDCLAPSLSYLSLNCSYFDFFIYDFSGRSEYNYFFRRKVSASRILQVPGALFLEFFQKLFAVCTSL